MNANLKTELDVISDIHQENVKSTFIKERLEQTKDAYKREYVTLVKDLLKKSNEYGLVNAKDVENYIQELSEKSNLNFQNLLDSWWNTFIIFKILPDLKTARKLNRNTENMNINELIDFNLSRINRGEDVRELELKGLDNKTLSESKCLALYDKLISESLIDTDKYGRIHLLSRAYEIINYGGWAKFIIDSQNEKTELNNRTEAKEKLEIDNLKLQKEASEYQKSIRSKEGEILILTRDNLRLGNWDIRFRWYIAIGGFIFGFITKYFMDN